MNENYNKYSESLNIDCGCNSPIIPPVEKASKNYCCEGGLHSHDNTIEIHAIYNN